MASKTRRRGRSPTPLKAEKRRPISETIQTNMNLTKLGPKVAADWEDSRPDWALVEIGLLPDRVGPNRGFGPQFQVLGSGGPIVPVTRNWALQPGNGPSRLKTRNWASQPGIGPPRRNKCHAAQRQANGESGQQSITQ